MRLRKKRNLDVRMERCSHLLIPNPAKLRGQWLDVFCFKDLHVELGCGKGRFTAETAKAEPNIFIAALERLDGAIITALERANGENLRNIRYINSLADNLADYFAEGEVSRIYINFCDPWPARRHEKRRLTSRRFLEIYKEVLCPGGQVHFKTDNQTLFDFSLREFEVCGFEPLEITRNLHKSGPVGVMTDYELKFHRRGLPIFRVCQKKVSGKQILEAPVNE